MKPADNPTDPCEAVSECIPPTCAVPFQISDMIPFAGTFVCRDQDGCVSSCSTGAGAVFGAAVWVLLAHFPVYTYSVPWCNNVSTVSTFPCIHRQSLTWCSNVSTVSTVPCIHIHSSPWYIICSSKRQGCRWYFVERTKRGFLRLTSSPKVYVSQTCSVVVRST